MSKLELTIAIYTLAVLAAFGLTMQGSKIERNVARTPAVVSVAR